MGSLTVVWDVEAKASFQQWINYVKEDSLLMLKK